MGVVYEAFDHERNVAVALKTLKRVERDAPARFKREFRALQGLPHPNLIALDELFFENGQWFFTMELLDGVDFVTHVTGMRADHLAQGSTIREQGLIGDELAPALAGSGGAFPFDETKLREGLRQLLSALCVLHAADKVHRDIKPSNVLVTRGGRLVLLDFGLVTEASSEEERSTVGAVVGTPAYMSPEQASARDVGPQSDLYSVGVMLYETLTGRLPIEGAPLQILMEKQSREPPPPDTLVPTVPADLNAICVKLLRFEPASRPSAAAVLRALSLEGSHVATALRTSTDSPTFVGRSAELAELRAAFETTRGGESATVLVCGESGIGKSYMVRCFTDQVQMEQPDALLLEGRCYERESVPYKTLDGIADALSRRLSRMRAPEIEALLPARSGILGHVLPVFLRVPQLAKAHASLVLNVEPQELRSRAFAALRDLFTRLALRRPTILVIDDLQWADDDGLRALAQVLRQPDAPPLLLIATLRVAPGGDEATLKRIRATIPSDARVLSLGSLTMSEARQMATALIERAGAPGADSERIANEARGHPLFLEELARHIEMGQAARNDVKLDDAIWSRVVQLEGPTRAMAELVAVAGKPIPPEVLAAAAGFAPGEFNRRAAMLRASNLVRTGGARWLDALEPYHDRVREAVLANLDSGRKRAVHESLAIAFESSPYGDPETLAAHWWDAGNARQAGKHAMLAGEQASRKFAFERAAEWYERALEWSLPGDVDRKALEVRIGDMLASAGRGALAAPHFERAAAASPPMQALDLRRRAAEELLSAGRFEEGDAVLRDVLKVVGIDLPQTAMGALFGLLFFRCLVFLRGLGFRERTEDDIAAHALTRLEACNGVGRALALVDTIRGAYFQTRALLEALSLGEPKRIARSLAIEAIYLGAQGTSPRARRLLVQARMLAEKSGPIQLQAFVETAIGFTHFVLGEFAQGQSSCDHSAETLRENCPSAWWELRTAQMGAIWTVAWRGDLNELATRVERGVREARDRGDIYAGTSLRTGVLNLSWLRGGDATEARRVVVEAMGQWTQAGYHSQHFWALVALARIDLYEGRGAEAYERIVREWPRVSRAMILKMRIMGAEARHLRGSAALAAAAGLAGTERARMIRAAEADVRALHRMKWPVATALGSSLRGGAAALRGNPDIAVDELRRAAREYDELAMKLHAAATRWTLGGLIGSDEGSTLVQQAESWMKDQGVADCPAMVGMLTPAGLRP